ncbi:unnamed protein product [Rotaria sp. Silwood1]|nr:unnamed protein product [Rotaria sp. Silwood1]CAF3801370.1 unnamed protein product [Rotaria sp. Silwood1]CAF3864239.1 unnamed protein product [Rotaria sp. Silwood1]CAF5005106.1 unnamed protein product [Rotaria sp. Silwood1]CAF5055842.1 unnamed protein product [Rotaria sp. Silwood1]
MANPAKIIIITSDEDIIRQFAFNKNKNTYIIDMDNNNNNNRQIIPIEKNDNNTIKSNFLPELTRNDQINKRTIDTTDHNQSKSVKTRKKSTDLICTICGDRAIGYNYAVLSCASCKAFFHRNGHQDLKRFKCLTDHGQCVIDYLISRKCFRCRLERCFAMGMRKDLILNQEQIQRRKDSGRNRNISSKRSSTIELTNSLSTSNSKPNSESILLTFDEIDRLFMDMNQNNDNIIVRQSIDSNQIEENILAESLTVEDLEAINKIQSSFLSIVNECEEFTNFDDPFDRSSELICCLQFNNEIALHIIKFCRLIEKFEKLNADDRFIMIKYNLILLFCVSTCYIAEQINDCSSNREHEEKRQMYILCNQSDYIYEMVVNLSVTFNDIIEKDDVLLSLLLVVFLFSKGLSMNENEPSFKDSLAVYRAQSYYIKLLWNYMIKKQGETKTCKHFIKLLSATFRAQSVALRFRQFLSSQVTTLDAIDDIAPLMQTILHIS